MQTTAKRENSPLRLRLADEICIARADEIKREVLEALAQAEQLELDLSGISEIDSAGFQVLVLLKREAQLAGKRVALCGHSQPVLRLFDLYNAAALFGDPIVIPSQLAGTR